MKSFKSLFALIVAAAFSSNAVANTPNPLNAIKETVNQQAIQTKEAVSAVQHSVKSAASDKVSTLTQNAENKVENTKETVSSTKTGTMAKVESVKKAAKVNINKADEKLLQTLDGIGEAKAKAIIEYRKQHGKIKNLAELSKISGIGESTLEKLKGAIRF